MMNARLSLAALLVATVALAGVSASENYELEGAVKGDFELLGSLCFPKGEDDKIVVKATGGDEGVMILFFDDQIDSFPKVNEAVPCTPSDTAKACVDARGQGTIAWRARTCQERTSLAKTLSSSTSSSTSQGLVLEKNEEKSIEITIKEKFDRQWYFVATNCGEGKKALVKQYSITSEKAIPCSELYGTGTGTPYVVAIVFLCIITVALIVASVIFYRAGRQPVLNDGNLTGYNEL